jgi:hypothetical protein
MQWTIWGRTTMRSEDTPDGKSDIKEEEESKKRPRSFDLWHNLPEDLRTRHNNLFAVYIGPILIAIVLALFVEIPWSWKIKTVIFISIIPALVLISSVFFKMKAKFYETHTEKIKLLSNYLFIIFGFLVIAVVLFSLVITFLVPDNYPVATQPTPTVGTTNAGITEQTTQNPTSTFTLTITPTSTPTPTLTPTSTNTPTLSQTPFNNSIKVGVFDLGDCLNQGIVDYVQSLGFHVDVVPIGRESVYLEYDVLYMSEGWHCKISDFNNGLYIGYMKEFLEREGTGLLIGNPDPYIGFYYELFEFKLYYEPLRYFITDQQELKSYVSFIEAQEQEDPLVQALLTDGQDLLKEGRLPVPESKLTIGVDGVSISNLDFNFLVRLVENPEDRASFTFPALIGSTIRSKKYVETYGEQYRRRYIIMLGSEDPDGPNFIGNPLSSHLTL